MTRPTKKFNGKIYHEHGPYFCPNGLKWRELKEHVEELRKNHLVRVVKKERKPDAVNRNTHEVWIYVREKR